MKQTTLLVAALLCSATIPAQAHNSMTHQSANKKWSLGYSYENMKMEGMRDGTRDLSNADVFAQGFMMTPTEMTMQMHMFHAGYQMNHRLAFMAMLPYHVNHMDMIDNMGMTSSMKSSGLGDFSLSGQYGLWKSERSGVNVTLGLSLPTGSIDEGSGGTRYSYAMQLGSGTWDPMVGIGYYRQYQSWRLGADISTTLRFGENDNGYRLGNAYKLSLSAARALGSYFTGTVRLDGSSTDDVHGSDTQLMTGMSPENRGDFYGGERIDGVVALQFHPSALPGNLSAEFGLPLYQHTNGPQLEQDYRFKLGGHFTF